MTTHCRWCCLHGTFWSRVWLPVLPALGTARRCIALDLPGFARAASGLPCGRPAERLHHGRPPMTQYDLRPIPTAQAAATLK